MRMLKTSWLKSALFLIFFLIIPFFTSHADPGAVKDTQKLTDEQAYAAQLGVYFWGTAFFFDLCAEKGFLQPSTTKAADQADSLIYKQMPKELIVFYRQGCDIVKQGIDKPGYVWSKSGCDHFAKQWNKIKTMYGIR